MGSMTITAADDFDLTEVYDRIADGELGDLVDVESLKGPAKGGTLFGASSGRIPVITIQLKSPITDDQKAEVIAKLRAMFGSSAHIDTR